MASSIASWSPLDLLCKFPAFDPTWSPDVCDRWWQRFVRLSRFPNDSPPSTLVDQWTAALLIRKCEELQHERENTKLFICLLADAYGRLVSAYNDGDHEAKRRYARYVRVAAKRLGACIPPFLAGEGEGDDGPDVGV